jgi:CheY-like chemotaxis protein
MQRTLADDGSLRSIVGTSQDITDEAIATDPISAIATFTGALAHEINNPLAVISAVLQMMPATSATGDALRAVERISSIIGDLSLCAFGAPASRVAVHLEQAIGMALGRVRDLETRAKVTSRLEATIPVRANGDTLCRVLVELVENALDAVESAPLKEVSVSTRNDGREWSVVEIADTGVGIASALQMRVFDPFYTTKGVGRRGLGLSICRGIVDSLGGSITLHSQLGGGTRVVVALPTTASQPTLKKVTDLPPVAVTDRGRVLVVDDEVLFANALSRLLTAEHEVTVVHDGRRALDVFEAGARFDAILCDVTMPEMSGAELHGLLLERLPDQAQRMIFITGGATPEALAALGDAEIFEKPCDVAKLREAVRRRVAASRRHI